MNGSAVIALLVLLTSIAYYIPGSSATGDSYLAKLWVTEPVILGTNGGLIDELEVGQLAAIRVSLFNNIENDQPYLLLVEVRDGDGRSINFNLSEGIAPGNGNITIATYWIPREFCHEADSGCSSVYEIRVFAISDLENPEMLSNVNQFQGITVVEATFHGNRVYPFLFYDREYEIEYAMDSGFIQRITADLTLRSLAIELEKVDSDTRLTLTLPVELTRAVFLGAPADLPVFVDTLLVQTDVHQGDGETTWIITLPEGSTEVEVADSVV